jgi:hypothetical protein
MNMHIDYDRMKLSTQSMHNGFTPSTASRRLAVAASHGGNSISPCIFAA